MYHCLIMGLCFNNKPLIAKFTPLLLDLWDLSRCTGFSD